MNAQYPVGLGVREELDHTVSVEVGLRTRVGGEGEVADIVLDTGLLELLLALTDPGDFGMGVHDRGNGAVVDVAVALGDVLDGSDSLLLSLVGKHGAEGNVTNGTNVLDLGAVLLVDDQAATVVSLETDVVKTQTSSVRTATDSDEDDIGVELWLVSICSVVVLQSSTHRLGLATLSGLNVDLDALLRNLTSGNLGVELEVQALLLEQLLSVLGNLQVHAGATDLAQELNNGDLRAETRPDGGLCPC